jgi:hypothetical protein
MSGGKLWLGVLELLATLRQKKLSIEYSVFTLRQVDSVLAPARVHGKSSEKIALSAHGLSLRV